MVEKIEENITTGFQAIVNKNNSYFSRIFWTLAIIISVSLMFLCFYGILMKYNYEPDFGIKSFQKEIRNIPFPAVTICAPTFAKNNLASYRNFGKFFEAGGKNLSAKEQSYFAANYQSCNPTNEIGDYILVQLFMMNRNDNDTIRLIQESSLSFEDLMLVCGLNGEIIDCAKNFKRVLTDRGLCYTFNMQDTEIIFNDVVSDAFKTKKLNKTDKNPVWTLDKQYPKSHKNGEVPLRAIKENRFTVLLNLKHENAENFCPTAGRVFRTILHLPNEIPTMFHREFFTHYNFIKTFILTATSYRADEEIRKYPPKTRGCYFQNERKLKFFKTYTKAQCDLECLTNYTLKSCGCVKFSMPHEQNTKICDLDQMKCYTHAMDKWPEKNDANEVACNCLQTCNDIEYGIKFERESSVDFTKDFLGSSLRDVNSTDAIIGVRFLDHLVTEHRKFTAYQFNNFIADMGGLLGLFLGCSLISFVELFYTIARLISEKRKIQDRVQEINNDKSTTNMSMRIENDFIKTTMFELSRRINNLEEKIGNDKNDENNIFKIFQ